jgi:predicted DNA-binding WGR domain protein
MRTLSDAKSHKFWNIEQAGSSFTVTYGRVGSTGQTQTKKFTTEEEGQGRTRQARQGEVKKRATSRRRRQPHLARWTVAVGRPPRRWKKRLSES